MKILIEQLHGMGDTVCALPKIKKIREIYPSANITVIVKLGICKELIEMSRIRVDQIVVFDVYKSIMTSCKIFKMLNSKKFDIMYSSVLTPIVKAKFFKCFINPKKWIALQKDNICYSSFNDTLHFVEAEMLSMNMKDDFVAPELFPDANNVQKIKMMIPNSDYYKKIVGFCIGKADISYKYKIIRSGKVYTRAWDTDKYIEIIKRLRRNDVLVLLIGGKQEKEIAKYMNKFFSSDNGVIDFVGKTSLKESIALSSICDLQVGVDTGMQHIASALGIQTLSIFGPTNPNTHGAYGENSNFVVTEPNLDCQFCFGSRKYLTCRNRICLNNISADKVYKSIISILKI